MRKYTAHPTIFLPNHSNLDDLQNANAFACLSLANPNFYRGKLTAVLNFLHKNFNKVLVATTGYLYRHNYTLSEKKLSTSNDMQYIINELSTNELLLSSDRFILNTWLDLYITQDFKKAHEDILHMHLSSNTFRNEVKNIAHNFIEKNKNHYNNINIMKKTDDCIAFLLEEFAMIHFMVKNGFTVGVYPGPIPPVIENIITQKNYIDQHPFASKLHKNLKYISLKLKRIGTRNTRRQPENISQ